jgi:hypothetical protein
MSYTILTIPFNLKEKADGDFLKKGFVIDDIVPEFFEAKDLKNPFLHVASFKQDIIKKTAINLFVESNFPDFKFCKNIVGNLFEKTTFFDKKYSRSNHDHINITDYNQKIEINKDNESFKIPYAEIDFEFLYTKELTDKEDVKYQSKVSFKIVDIKLLINKSFTTKNAIGFGFIEIVLEWNFSNAISMIENLEPISELFRFYGDANKNDFEISWTDQIKGLIEKYTEDNKRDKIPTEGIEANNFKISNLNRILLSSKPKKIHFKLLVDELLKFLVSKNDVEEVFSFTTGEFDAPKPNILHLSILKSKDEVKTIDFENSDFTSKIYRMIRISGAKNIEINKKSNFSSFSPDLYIRQFVLNEGAFVIEGVSKCLDLFKKYNPSFIFALNQKYLFNYMQEKINDLPIDTGKYKSDDLKHLQETLIYAEFSQIFTTISNVNEIDLFFENLRDQFKIKQLKEEYFDSINGISKITQLKDKEIAEAIRLEEESNRIKEKEAAEAIRNKEETNRRNEKEAAEIEREKYNKISEIRAQKLNAVLLLLAIAQVWTGLYSSVPFNEFDANFKWWILNPVVYTILGIIGYLFYKDLSKKEIEEKDKKCPNLHNNSSVEKSNTV